MVTIEPPCSNSDSQCVLKLLQKDGVRRLCAFTVGLLSPASQSVLPLMVARGPITTTIFLAVMRCLFPGTPFQTGVKIAEMSDKAKVTETITFEKNSPVIFDSGGLVCGLHHNSLLAQYHPDLLRLPTINGMHCTRNDINMGEDFGARTIDLQWVQVHPTGLVKPDDPDAKIKFLAAEALRGVGGLVFDAFGNLFAYELSRRDYVTREMWKNKPPLRLALNRAASDEIARHCKHYTERGVMKFYESGAALAEGMGVPVSKMPGSFEALCQASLQTAKDPDGGPCPAYPSGESWYEASGKTGSGKKFEHNVISGVDFAAQPYYVAIITPVIHYCMGGLETDKKVSGVGCGFQARSCLLRSWRGCRRYTRQQPIGRQFSAGLRGVWSCCGSGMCAVHAGRSLAALAGGGKRVKKVARPVWEENRFWIAWFAPAWQAQHVPSTGGRGGDGFRHHQSQSSTRWFGE